MNKIDYSVLVCTGPMNDWKHEYDYAIILVDKKTWNFYILVFRKRCLTKKLTWSYVRWALKYQPLSSKGVKDILNQLSLSWKVDVKLIYSYDI